MAEMFSTLGTWNWLIFGFVLMALELLAPGVFMFWLGLAALLVGLLSFAINPSWQTQLLMFAVFAVAAVPAWRHFARSASSRSVSNPFLNRRTEALIGREFTLERPIVDGTGTVRIDDTVWRVAGPDAPADSRACITVGEASSQAVRSAREVSGPWRSSQTMRSVQRRPSRSSRAMTGRPVLEPRTAVFLTTAAGFDIESPLACCYR